MLHMMSDEQMASFVAQFLDRIAADHSYDTLAALCVKARRDESINLACAILNAAGIGVDIDDSAFHEARMSDDDA